MKDEELSFSGPIRGKKFENNSSNRLIHRTEFDFEPTALLGTGSYSCVYKGQCRGTVCAIKKNTVPLDTKVLADLRAEITALRDSPHPNIVMCMGVCVDGGDVYLVTEFCGGGTLDELLHEKPDLYLPTWKTMTLAGQVAKGLAWIHGAGYMHRDLKPANVFLTDQTYSSCKIGDFGFAIKGEGRKDGKGSGLWLAPEKMRQEPESFKSDVYSLSILIWECLTRRDPYEEFDDPTEFCIAVCERKVRPPIPPLTPSSLSSLLRASWDDDPEQRPDAAQLSDAFPSIVIDVSIDDPSGREFWREHFKDEFAIAYDSLANLLLEPRHSVDLVLLDYLFAAFRPENDVTTADDYGIFLKRFGPINSEHALISSLKSVFEKQWFWPELSLDEAQQYLQTQPTGTFLIRFPSQAQYRGSYTLSRVENGKVAHRRITLNNENGVRSYVDRGKSYPTLDALLLDAKLGEPLNEPGKISRLRRSAATIRGEYENYEDLMKLRPTHSSSREINEHTNLILTLSGTSSSWDSTSSSTSSSS